jgi:NADH-quinone oxidoreductase subunit M
VVFGEVGNAHVAELKDANLREQAFLLILALLVLGMGLYPKPVTDTLHASVEHLIQQTSVSKLPVVERP